MKLKKIGFFKELPYGDPLGDSLEDAVGKLNNLKLKNIISYLQSGHLLVLSPGISRDILSADQKIIGSMKILTDGVYAWPMDILYYIEKYKIKIPEEFLDHMKARNWVVDEANIMDLEL